MNDSDLDTLLGATLPEIADEGFSARAMARIVARRAWSEQLVLIAATLAVAAIVPFLPGIQLSEIAHHLTPSTANSVGLSIAAAALALTISFERRLHDWQSAL